MTDHGEGSHQPWGELVAGHALHALVPDEELRLVGHLDGCGACRARLDEYSLVAAQLGSLADGEAQPPAWSDIRSRLITPSRRRQEADPDRVSPAPVIPLRRRIGARLLAAAAAVIVIGGVGAGWHVASSGHQTSTFAALTACQQQAGCQVVQLHGRSGDNAAVLVEAGHASLVPTKMAAPPADSMYVLWQLPRDGGPIPVVTFRDPHRQTSSVPLVTGYSDTAAFAVSLEDAGPMPTHPSDVLALGAATS